MAKEREETYEILVKALNEVFGDKTDKQKRFVDVSRIPLLCASIINTNKTLDDLSKTMKHENMVQNKKLQEHHDTLLEHNNQLRKIFQDYSGISGQLVKYKTEREKEMEDTVTELKSQLQKKKQTEEKMKNRIIIGIILAILFIAGFIGLINPEFINSIM